MTDRAARDRRDVPGTPLTAHQLLVLRYISYGYAYSQIATRMGITVDSVKSHVRSLFRRIDARNGAHAVRLGLESGLLRWSQPEPTSDDLPTPRRRTPSQRHVGRPLLVDESEEESDVTR